MTSQKSLITIATIVAKKNNTLYEEHPYPVVSQYISKNISTLCHSLFSLHLDSLKYDKTKGRGENKSKSFQDGDLVHL